MAIIKSCCFWKSLRKGCFASAVYTLMYFLTSCISISLYLYDERDYLAGKVDKPMSKSFLGTSPMNLWFSMMFLGCAVLGVISSFLVLIGLRKDQREFLAPFIIIMFLDISLAILHFIVVVAFGNLKFEPLTGILFTVDFFILCLNMYCLVCVVSQYQEYKEYGCVNHFIINNGAPRCSTPEKSCIVNGHTNITLIQEPHMNGSANVGVLTKSPFQRRKNTTLLKKQVKFTDDLKCCSDILTTVVNDKERGDEMTFVENDKDSKRGKLAVTFLKDVIRIWMCTQVKLFPFKVERKIDEKSQSSSPKFLSISNFSEQSTYHLQQLSSIKPHKSLNAIST